MKKYAPIIAAVLFLFPSPSLANEAMCRNILRSVHTSGIYQPLACCGNVKRMIDEMKKLDPSMKEGEVLFFLGEKYVGSDVPVERIAYISPKAAPSAQGQTWASHVVFSLKGKIYDADIADLEPATRGEYIAKMFPKSLVHPTGGLESHLLVRSIPMELFVTDVETLGIDKTVEKYAGKRDKIGNNGAQLREMLNSLNRNAPDHPIKTYQQFLDELP